MSSAPSPGQRSCVNTVTVGSVTIAAIGFCVLVWTCWGLAVALPSPIFRSHLHLREVPRFFNLSSRPQNALLNVSYGEQPLPTLKDDSSFLNPWWGSLKTWSRAPSNGGKRQKVVLVTGLPRSGTTLMEMFFRQFRAEISTLRFSPGNDVHEGWMQFSGTHDWVIGGYGGSADAYSRMCGVHADGTFKDARLQNDGRNKTLVRIMQVNTWKHWQSFDFKKPLLVEKSPTHFLRMQFWQRVFESTHDVFPIFTLMHPLESITKVPCDPQNELRTKIVPNWIQCHRPWIEDLKRLRNYLVVPYEAWFLYPEDTADAIENYLNLRRRLKIDPPTLRRLVVHGDRFVLKKKYMARCRNIARGYFDSLKRNKSTWPSDIYKHELATFGYDLYDSAKLYKPSAFSLCKLDGLPCP